MARLTVEDCLKQINNRFALVKIAVKRAKQLLEGAPRLVDRENKEIVISLREIAAGKVQMVEPVKKKKSTALKFVPVDLKKREEQL